MKRTSAKDVTSALERLAESFWWPRLVHWCHGAVGLLPLLLEVEGLCSGAEAARVHAAAERAGQVIWERGLLLKVGSMTHTTCTCPRNIPWTRGRKPEYWVCGCIACPFGIAMPQMLETECPGQLRRHRHPPGRLESALQEVRSHSACRCWPGGQTLYGVSMSILAVKGT